MPIDNKSETEQQFPLSRRRTIELMGTGATVALAGCASLNSGSDSEGGGGAKAVENMTMADTVNPQTVQWNNYYAKKQVSRVVRKHLFDPFAKSPAYATSVPSEKTVEYPNLYPMLAKDWSVDGSTATVKINKNYSWHNGDKLTADDVVLQFKIEKQLGLDTWNNVSKVHAPDKYTVEFELSKSPVNETILFLQLLSVRPLTTPSSVYSKHLKKMKKGGDKAAQEFLNTKIKEPIGNGPFKIRKIASQKYLLEPHEGHPASDAINYELEVNYVPEVQTMQQGLISGRLDAVERYPIPEKVQSQFPSSVETFPFPSAGGGCVLFNHARKPWSNRLVRKALALVLDRKRIASNALDYSVTPKTITGLPPSSVQKWIGNDFVDKNYTIYKPDRQQATKLLKGEGFTKQNGKWMTPDGKRFKAPIIAPSGGTYPTVGKSAAGMFRKFGIKSALYTKSTAAYGKALDTRNFELCVTMHGASQMHYYPILRGDFRKRKVPFTNMSLKRKIPMPIGDPSGKIQTVDLNKKLSSLVTSTDEKTTRKLIREITWTYNQDVPSINTHFWVVTDYLTKDHWKYPKAANKKFFNPAPIMLPKLGALTAKTE